MKYFVATQVRALKVLQAQSWTGAVPGKMLLVMIIENDEIDA